MTASFVSPRRKFTFAQAQAIRTEYAETKELRPLARRWGCDQTTVRGIVKGETYTEPGPLDAKPAPRFELLSVEPKPDPIALYRHEKAKREQRLAFSTTLAEAKQAFAAQLERDREAGKGGRPKGSKTKGIEIPRSTRGGKPRLFVERDQVPDLTTGLNPFFGL